MAVSDMTLVKGTRLQTSPDGVTYTTLVDISELGAPGNPKRPKIDKTPIDPTTTFREYSLGLADGGEFGFKQFWNSAREVVLQAIYGTNYYWRILYPDATLDANKSRSDFQGAISDLSKTTMNNPDGKLELDCKVQINGAVVFTPKT